MDCIAKRAAVVHRFVAARVLNRADAEDIAQQTLLRACTKLHTFRGGNVEAWLLTIANRQMIDHYRQQRRRSGGNPVTADLDEQNPRLQSPPEAVLTVCECRERLGFWLTCITLRLRLEEQVAVLLADLHGYRDKDSAAKMSMSIPSFKLLLHGARSRLNTIAEGNCALLRKLGRAAAGNEPAPPEETHKRASCRCRPQNGCTLVKEHVDAGGDGVPAPRTREQIGAAGGRSHPLPVKCRLSKDQLLDLRKRLLSALGIGLTSSSRFGTL